MKRKEAQRLGLTTYETGKPCKRGHTAPRYTVSHACSACLYETNTKWKKENADIVLERKRKYQKSAQGIKAAHDYYENNKKKILAQSKQRYAENKDAVIARTKEWYSKNKNKKLATSKEWKQSNPEKVSLYSVNRRAAQLQRTPPWADMEAIKFFYECRPKGCHVDHTIPLQGEFISGLHVAENLQWLPAVQNMQKGNRVDWLVEENSL